MIVLQQQATSAENCCESLRILEIVIVETPGILVSELYSDWLCTVLSCDADVDPHIALLDEKSFVKVRRFYIREWSYTSIKPGIYKSVPKTTRQGQQVFIASAD